ELVANGTSYISKPAAGLVSPPPARPAVAAHARSLPHLAFGNHAPANAGHSGCALLSPLPSAVPCSAGAGTRAKRGSAQTLGGTRLLQPGAQPASRGQRNRCAPQRPLPARTRSCAPPPRDRPQIGRASCRERAYG